MTRSVPSFDVNRDSIRYEYAHSILPYGDESVWNNTQLVPGHRVSLMVRVSACYLIVLQKGYRHAKTFRPGHKTGSSVVKMMLRVKANMIKTQRLKPSFMQLLLQPFSKTCDPGPRKLGTYISCWQVQTHTLRCCLCRFLHWF